MLKYCQCKYIEDEHALTKEHSEWVRSQNKLKRKRGDGGEQPMNTDNIVSETLRISLENSDANPTFSARSPVGDGILSAVTASFDALLAQLRHSKPNPKRPSQKQQSDDLLRAILLDIEKATRSLDLERIGSLHIDKQWDVLDAAAKELAMSAKALQVFDDGTEEKNYVEKQLRILENLVVQRREKLPSDTRPYYYDCAYVFQDPMANIDVVAQLMVLLGLVCSLIMNLSKKSVEFILGVVTMMVKYTMSISEEAPMDESYTDIQQYIIDQLPTSLHDAMTKLNLDGKTVLFAACPSCDHIHAPILSASKVPTWPSTCKNTIPRKMERSVCGNGLLVSRKMGAQPIKPFLSPSFLDYLARLMSDPKSEQLLLDAYHCTATSDPPAIGSTFVRDIFKSDFLQSFKARDGSLFIDPGPDKRMKLVFGFSLDFFPHNGSRKRSGTNSVGLLAIYCLNFPLHVRYLPENMHISIITGKKEPGDVNPYLRPTVDVGVIAWERGIRLSRTALSEKGRVLEAIFPLSVNDLPAARKVSGTAGHKSNVLCTVCDLRGRQNLYRTDFENWKLRDCAQMRADAEAWRDANTLSERTAIFTRTGSRFSELWRFFYWNPPFMLVVDAMHDVFQGLGKYFSREVLMIDLNEAKKPEDFIPAFDPEFLLFDSTDKTIPQCCKPASENAERDISSIHRLLVSPLREELRSDDDKDGDPADTMVSTEKHKVDETPETLAGKLANKQKTALIFVCWSLELAKSPNTKDPRTGAPIKWEEYFPRVSREQLAQLLLDWRMSMPRRHPDDQQRPKTITMSDLRFIQQVIADTDRPAWVHHVPKNYGEPGAGSIKADQMRLLMTIYLPIALVILWAEKTGPDAAHFRTLLEHAMALFQAVTIVCRYATTPERATAYRNYLTQWVDGLYTCHPHTKFHEKRTNVHIAFHIYDFLKLWGPVISWWAFPVERLIGLLQKIQSNGRVGGEHEATVLTTWMRGANLRRWLKGPKRPKVLEEFHSLFNLYHASKLDNPDIRPEIEVEPRKTGLQEGEQAYYDFAGMHFSRGETHVGNSLVSYLDDGKIWFGSIEKIKVSPQGSVTFAIRHQEPLPPGKNDPFKEFIHFPARAYSSKMAETLVDVAPNKVLGHYARFSFSDERAVVLDLRRD